MKKFNEVKDKIDAQKAECLKDVLFMERDRFIYLISCYMKPLEIQTSIGAKMISVKNDIPKWKTVCDNKDALSVCYGEQYLCLAQDEQIAALMTASEQTFKNLGGSGNEDVVLYQGTNMALKNVDENNGGTVKYKRAGEYGMRC